MTNEQKEFWKQISINPMKWKEEGYGKEGHGFWVVGHFNNKVIWYNDIENGFNISDLLIPTQRMSKILSAVNILLGITKQVRLAKGHKASRPTGAEQAVAAAWDMLGCRVAIHRV